jgi:hypothetical protein
MQKVGVRQHAGDHMAEQCLAEQHKRQKSHKSLVVASAHAVAQDGAVVVEALHATPVHEQVQDTHCCWHCSPMLVVPSCCETYLHI